MQKLILALFYFSEGQYKENKLIFGEMQRAILYPLFLCSSCLATTPFPEERERELVTLLGSE